MSPSIIPHPVSVEERDGTYALHSGQSITARGAASAALPAVQGLLADAGIALQRRPTTAEPSSWKRMQPYQTRECPTVHR